MSSSIFGGNKKDASNANKQGNKGKEQYSLEDCIKIFTADEVLDGEEMYKCEVCKEKRKCVKKMYLYRLPKILVLQLKRFRTQLGIPMLMGGEKVTTDVKFPVKGLNLNPFVSPDSTLDVSAEYDLCGVSHHMGGTGGGHYVAQVDTGAGSWTCFNDEKVDSIQIERVSGLRHTCFSTSSRETLKCPLKKN